MYQLILLIPSTVYLKTFDDKWPTFLEVAEQMPGLIRESVALVDQSIYGQESIRRIYTFSFQDKAALEGALVSPPGEKAGKLLHELTGGNVTLLIADFQEDTLDHIQSFISAESGS